MADVPNQTAKNPGSNREAIENDIVALYRTDWIFGINHRVAKVYVEPKADLGYHAHTFYEINFILAGEGTHYMGDRSIPATRGDVFIIPPNHRHAYRGASDNFRIYNLIFHPRFFEMYLSSLRPLPGFLSLFEVEPLMRATGGFFYHILLKDETLAEVTARLDALHALDQQYESAALIAACECMTIIAILCEEYERTRAAEYKDDAFFSQALTMIFEHLAEPLTIEALAEAVHLSRSSFLRKFNQIIGMSPHRFIQKERIKSAGQLLRNTDMTVARVAEEVGFYDVSHFVRAFTAAIGYSPTEYRKIKPVKTVENKSAGNDYLYRYRFSP